MAERPMQAVAIQIPDELVTLKQWTYSHSIKELKRPMHTKYKPNGALELIEAMAAAGQERYTGFYVTKSDPYLLVDVDHVNDTNNPWDNMPPLLAALLRGKETYSEVSPSGEGLRFLLKLSDPNEKDLVSGNYFLSAELEGKARKGVQINFGKPWMTITQNPTPYSVRAVAETSLKELQDVFRLKHKVHDLRTNEPQVEFAKASKLPTLAKIKVKFMSIPLDQNPRVVRAYEAMTGESYSHYEFWNKMLMALHDYASKSDQMTECFQLAIEWSKLDSDHYDGEASIRKHWDSFSSSEGKISYRSLFRIAYSSFVSWPVPEKQSDVERKLGAPRRPVYKVYKNFVALMDHYNIKLYRSEHNDNELYITGDRDIIPGYFGCFSHIREYYAKYYGVFDDRLITTPIINFMADHGYTRVGVGTAKELIAEWVKSNRDTVNLMKMYFTTPFDQLSEDLRGNACNLESSTFNDLFRCLEIDFQSTTTDDIFAELILYKTMYRKWLFGVVRGILNPRSPMNNNCILVLTGKEQIRKTSHFRYLFPEPFRDKVVFTTHGFNSDANLRDISRLSAQNLVLVWDEIEQYLNYNTETTFKRVIDSLPQTVVDKYQVLSSTFYPIAVYGGTSNQREFELSEKGNRRLFHIPVKWVDTEKMDQLCWYPILQELRRDYEYQIAEHEFPHLLTDTHRSVQEELQIALRKEDRIAMVLASLYDFEHKFEISSWGQIPGVSNFQNDDTGRLMREADVFERVCNRVHLNEAELGRFKSVLTRMCATYTRTMRRSKETRKPKMKILNGIAYMGPHRRMVMPPQRD